MIGLGQLSHTRSLHRWPWRILCRVDRAIFPDALKWQATMWRTSLAKSTTCTGESQDNFLVLKLVERSGFPVSSQIYIYIHTQCTVYTLQSVLKCWKTMPGLHRLAKLRYHLPTFLALQDSQMATPKAMEDIRNMTPVLEHFLYQHVHLPQKLIQV